MKYYKIGTLIIIGLILLCGCQNNEVITQSPDVKLIVYNQWQTIDPDIQMMNWPIDGGVGVVPLELYKFASTAFNVKMKNDSATPLNLAGWFLTEPNAKIMINGAYFLEDNTPAGYLVVNGERVGELIFDQDKSGALVINENKIELRDLKDRPLVEGEKNDLALQSYPLLILNGKTNVKEDSGLTARRTAIGLDAQGFIYLIILTQGETSLYILAQTLAATKINFTNVLNLDGGPSSGVIINTDQNSVIKNSLAPVPSVVVFLE
jgi:uncharacterized protein YigE (DUF2233 family)